MLRLMCGMSSGPTYLRGYQVTSSSAVTSFKTIFPGWYAGRTIHMHIVIRAFSSSQTFEFTTLIDAITTTVAPYSSHGVPDTTNANDNNLQERHSTDTGYRRLGTWIHRCLIHRRANKLTGCFWRSPLLDVRAGSGRFWFPILIATAGALATMQGRRSGRLPAFQQLQLCNARIPGGWVTPRERLQRRFFNNVQHFFLRRNLTRIHRRRRCLFGSLGQ